MSKKQKDSGMVDAEKEPFDIMQYKKYAVLIAVALPSLWGGGKLTDKLFFEEYRLINRQRDSTMIFVLEKIGNKVDSTNILLERLIVKKR